MKKIYKTKAKEILQEILEVKTKSLPGALPYFGLSSLLKMLG